MIDGATLLSAYGTVLLVASAVSALMLWWDKRAAQRGRWRISERALHLAEFLGGWPGSWLTRRAIRHKTNKRAYRRVYTLIVLSHVFLIAVFYFL